MLEVEIKARVRIEEIEHKLIRLGAKLLDEEEQKDIYFSHPCRDFEKKDEALRVRRVKEEYFLTYKGPKLDQETKTREEIQIKVTEKIFDLLERLSFSKVGEVDKTRRVYRWEDLEICLDRVKDLGEFLEIEGKMWQDRGKIFELLKKLGIPKKELIRKSYLEMLEDKIKSIPKNPTKPPT